MDANDVEMTMKRDRRDTDEVYPLEELNDNFEGAYQPAARRQNLWFAVGMLCFVMAVGAAFGVKLYVVPALETHAELESNPTSEQGTVSNNADNANAVSEALRDHKQTKKPHSSSWTGGDQASDQDEASTPQQQQEEEEKENLDQPENNNNNNPEVDTGADNNNNHNNNHNNNPHNAEKQKLNAWHEIKVSKSDGVMYEVLEVLSHDPQSFTEGLTYYDDKLYESVGLSGHSNVLVLDPKTGETLETYPMASKFFGEGLTYAHGKLYQLTYKKKKGFIYDVNNLNSPPEEFSYETTTGEGWGFTYDKKRDEFIVSDGSHFLLFWDRKTLKQVRKHQIMRLDGSKAKRINELEWWRDRVVANVWFEKVLLIINPTTGLVEKEYDFSTIWKVAGVQQNSKAEVFNGISVSDDDDILYVTGKWWAKMFKIKLLPEIPSS